MSDSPSVEVTETATEEPAQNEVTETATEDTKKQAKPADPTDQLPADHPLVKAFAAQKALIKELKPKAAQLDEIVESQKSENQKLLERAEAAEGVAYALQAAEEMRSWKEQVSKQTGIPVDVLRGSDLDEIEAHAASLKALLPEPRKPGQVPAEGRTVTTGTGDPAQQFAELIRNARK